MLASLSGAVAHVYLSTSNDTTGLDCKMHNAILGAAGGILGLSVWAYFMPNPGYLAIAGSAVGGMLAFDYFLFDM